jgi:acylphosphatase
VIVQTFEIVISGRVQKVGFRACIRKLAADLNITGTVINLPNGKVHICASGEAIVLEKFISMIYSCPRAVVRDLQTSEIPFKNFGDFSVIKGESRISTGL